MGYTEKVKERVKMEHRKVVLFRIGTHVDIRLKIV